MNIFDYFRLHFGIEPSDESLKELPLDSDCGEDCRLAIDAGIAFYRATYDAQGGYQDIPRLTEQTISVFWRG